MIKALNFTADLCTRKTTLDIFDKVVFEGRPHFANAFKKNLNTIEDEMYFLEHSLTCDPKAFFVKNTTNGSLSYKDQRYSWMRHSLTSYYNKTQKNKFVFLKALLKPFSFLLLYYPYKVIKEILSILLIFPKVNELKQDIERLCNKHNIKLSTNLTKISNKHLVAFIILEPLIYPPAALLSLIPYILLSIIDLLQIIIILPWSYLITKPIFHIIYGNPNATTSPLANPSIKLRPQHKVVPAPTNKPSVKPSVKPSHVQRPAQPPTYTS